MRTYYLREDCEDLQFFSMFFFFFVSSSFSLISFSCSFLLRFLLFLQYKDKSVRNLNVVDTQWEKNSHLYRGRRRVEKCRTLDAEARLARVRDGLII